MAGIDRIYGTCEQRRELKRFIRHLRLPGHVKRGMYRYFCPVGDGALANFPAWADRLLWRQPTLPAWVRERLTEQHGGRGLS